MKKKVSFLLMFLFIFILYFPSYEADTVSSGYYYYCDYNIMMVHSADTLPFTAYVYENSVEVIINDSEKLVAGKKGNYTGYVSWGGMDSSEKFLSFSFDEFLNAASKDGKYTCPSIIATSTDVSSVSLKFGSDKVGDDTFSVLTRSSTTDISKTINKNLSKEDQDKILGKQEVIDKSCSFRFPNNVLNHMELGSDMIVTYYVDNNVGYVELKIGTNTDRAPYPKTSSYNATLQLNYAGKSKYFNFYYDDYSKIFRETKWGSVRVNCPSSAPKIDFAREANSDYFVITYSNKVLDDIGTGNAIEGSTNINGSDGYKPGTSISSESGVCTDYLGHADTEDTIANLLNRIYLLIKVGSIVVVILMSMLEFARNVTDGKDNLMEIVKKFAKRLVILVVILLLPTFIDMLANLFGIEDILCGIK
jgi:hypothetical protein